MNLAKGDVVLVPFPFTDLSQTKLRPAIVLYVQPEGEDVTLCFISTQNLDRVNRDEFIIDLSHPEFAQTGLKSTSKVRVSRIVTLEQRLIKRKLGSLGLQLIENIDSILVDILLLG
ncbi:type II toxin-antitoxin system PemK/MazF family toxin [Chamaesiphon sp. VAR_69_metabat_338]|uniref:type II toxin-antitoxin system PemK/MazF family toxin n=1 Tax=Chamaesiphon sp. VAR_69_metabat_338 TaxID=2964704 RepID=UPI00286E837F|nr:type II toxin-antitoxin system PemK/MazF family toxin [Chamaesiphon sp. VAR_69_metabat_338]